MEIPVGEWVGSAKEKALVSPSSEQAERNAFKLSAVLA